MAGDPQELRGRAGPAVENFVQDGDEFVRRPLCGAASASPGLVWQPGRARTLGPSRCAHCPPASGGGGGPMPPRDSLSSGLPG